MVIDAALGDNVKVLADCGLVIEAIVEDLVAKQACRHAPWTIRQADLEGLLAARADQGPSTHVSGQLALDIQ